MFFSLVITGFPFAFLLMLVYLSGIDPTLERAAATLGALAQRFRRITLPLLAPGLATTFMPDVRARVLVFPSASLVGDAGGRDPGDLDRGVQAAFEHYDYPMARRSR